MRKPSWTLPTSLAILIASTFSFFTYQDTQAAEAVPEVIDLFGNLLIEPESEIDTANMASEPGNLINRESSDNPLIQIETSLGNIILELFPREAPQAVANFLALAEGSKEFIDPETEEWVKRPFYNGLIFHRVIENFMIQGGSPTGESGGGPGYQFDDEINARSLGLDRMPVLEKDGQTHRLLGINSQAEFQKKILAPLYQEMGITNQAELESSIDEIDERVRTMTVQESYENLGYQYTEAVISRTLVKGVVAMDNNGPNSNGSQFFITLDDTEWLTGKYTVFGKVRVGIEALDTIASVPVDANSKPFDDIVILTIKEI